MHMSDIILFDTRLGEAQTVSKDCGMKFWCRSQAIKVKNGTAVALVDDNDENSHLIRFDRSRKE